LSFHGIATILRRYGAQHWLDAFPAGRSSYFEALVLALRRALAPRDPSASGVHAALSTALSVAPAAARTFTPAARGGAGIRSGAQRFPERYARSALIAAGLSRAQATAALNPLSAIQALLNSLD
jgi:hypothetical protein